MPRLLRPRYARLIVLTIAAVLVLAQFALVRHQADVQKHLGDHCEWCLAHAHLGDASPAAAWPSLPTGAAILVAVVTLASLRLVQRTPYRVRAPPARLRLR